MCIQNLTNTASKLGREHDSEHRHWSRRSFIQALGIGCGGSLFLGGNMLSASSVSPLTAALNEADNDRVLVLIRLQGGNDGLNTIVPMSQYDTYANYRPNLYHRQNQLIRLSDEFSMPNYMGDLEALWGDGKMKVANGVGYEDQSLSHFTSSDIWAAAKKEEIYDSGFMGKFFSENYPDYLITPPEKPLAIQIGSIGNLLFEDAEVAYSFLVSNPDQLEQIAESGVQFDLNNIDKSCYSGTQQEFLRQQSNTTYAYSEVIHQAYGNASNGVEYADNKIAKQLAIVSRLIKGNLGTKVYLVTLNGFDTHSGQAEAHQRLMSELSGAVKNFYDDLAVSGHDRNVLAMTFSEFGRRAMENGSAGTDHGAASNTLFFGPGLEDNGFVGEYPDITDLERNGNLKFNTDFRGLYATVLSQWLCIDLAQVERSLGSSYDTPPLGFQCSVDPETPENPGNPDTPENPDTPGMPENPETPTEPNPDAENPGQPTSGEIPTTFSHAPFYDISNGACIHFEAHRAMHVHVELYNMIGQKMGTLFNEFVTEGSKDLIVRDLISLDSMAQGQYIYRITNFEGAASKIILIQ